ncbi:hypothetical protein SynA1562_01682 [Synechococcus sp. A15-62]|nr:hypothetical protein SynA1562_01682 [Synechococcus sp. A15-62]
MICATGKLEPWGGVDPYQQRSKSIQQASNPNRILSCKAA